MVTESTLISFERRVAAAFNDAKIRAPIHLHGGNEAELINIFADIDKNDWVFSSWRSHYHCLLKGVDENVLFNDICNGKSITLLYPEHKIYTSAIVGGIVPIALGAAKAIQLNGSTDHVYLFIGEMTSETGAASEAHRYAVNFDLPITFIIEDNGKSVCTDTSEAWGSSKLSLVGKPKVVHYTYELPWPHAGAGIRVQF
jgi:pyruvate dehydrogenase E1 component alpha subunit